MAILLTATFVIAFIALVMAAVLYFFIDWTPSTVSTNTIALTGGTATIGSSNTTYFITSPSATYTINLPDPEAGLKYTFIAGDTISANIVVSSGAGSLLIYGFTMDAGGTTSFQGTSVVTLTTANGSQGDTFTLTSDGTFWYLEAFAQAAGGITST